ncbi:MAG: glycosyltransferase family 2 protein [Pseudomonadota bacterium]
MTQPQRAIDLVSIVVPFLDEAETLPELATRIADAARRLPCDYEIIFVNDGSTDNGAEIAARLSKTDPRICLIDLMRNFGKAAALSAGMTYARGDVIVTMDADLQDDPRELPRFLGQIEAGCDVVSGWKQDRQDPIGKTLPSKVFNYMVRRAFDLDLHDINCGFKAYTRAAARALNLYGELHRFTPALLHGLGYSVKEIPVRHNPRRHGRSKYGAARIVKGLFDLVTVILLTRYQARPLHFFGGIALALGLLGGVILSYLTALWVLGMGPIGNRPLFFLGILLITTATQLFGVGLIAELLQTTQLRDSGKYAIREMVGFGEPLSVPETAPRIEPFGIMHRRRQRAAIDASR